MRGIVLILTLGFLLLAGCIGGQRATAEPPAAPISPPEPEVQAMTEFADGRFSLEYPSSWQPMEKQSEEDILNRIGGPPCALAVKKYPYLVPCSVKAAYSGYMPDAEWNDDVFEGDITAEGNEYHLRNRIVFCNCTTYVVSVGCLKSIFDSEAADSMLDSAECSYELPDIPSGEVKLGMIVIPPNEKFWEVYCANIRDAREAGASVTHMYFTWGDMERTYGERNWSSSDYVVEVNKLNNMKMSAVVSLVYTNKLGEIPRDIEFTSFSDPEFKERFGDFMVEFVGRYKDTVEYFEIGNEINIYLAGHPDEIDDFREFYSYTRDRIKAEYPDAKVGTVFAYHAARDTNTTYIIEELADVGDFNAFTLYIHGEKFAFNRSVDEADTYFDEIDAISPKPFVMTEVGWSSSPMLHSSEEKQVEYVDKIFEILERKKGRMEFVAWFDSHDLNDESCSESAESFVTPEMEGIQETEYWPYFEEFICKMGLRDVNDRPKLAWYEWMEKSREYTGIE